MAEQTEASSKVETDSEGRSSHTLILVIALGIYVAANHLIYFLEIKI